MEHPVYVTSNCAFGAHPYGGRVGGAGANGIGKGLTEYLNTKKYMPACILIVCKM